MQGLHSPLRSTPAPATSKPLMWSESGRKTLTDVPVATRPRLSFLCARCACPDDLPWAKRPYLSHSSPMTCLKPCALTCPSCARGAPAPMDVVHSSVREVKVDDQVDLQEGESRQQRPSRRSRDAHMVLMRKPLGITHNPSALFTRGLLEAARSGCRAALKVILAPPLANVRPAFLANPQHLSRTLHCSHKGCSKKRGALLLLSWARAVFGYPSGTSGLI